MLLPESGSLSIKLRLFPAKGCSALGVLMGYRAPDWTQGIRVEGGLDPRLSYFRREGPVLLEPPGAVIPVPREAYATGLLLEVTTWSGAIQARLPEVGSRVVWHAPGWTGNRLALFAEGSALFSITRVGAPTVPAPLPSGEGLLARVRLAADAQAHLGAYLDQGLATLECPNASPVELLPAWLWTGHGGYRDRARAWVERNSRAEPDRALLEGLTAAGYLMGQAGKEALRRMALPIASALLTEDPDPARLPVKTEALLEWIRTGAALQQAANLLHGKERDTVFQAHRASLGRLVMALQPVEGSFLHAWEWETEALLAAAEWIGQAAALRSDAGRLLVSIGLFLEERRLALLDDRLIPRDRAGNPRPDLTLAWALFLARRAALADDPSCLFLAETLALNAPPQAGSFRIARDLAVAIPYLAPPGTLSIGTTSTRVVALHRGTESLYWTTQGPSTETILVQVPDLILEVDGQIRQAHGPLIEVSHVQGEARLGRPRPELRRPLPER